ncbi:ADP-glyceromanno-heptose 6-epimerase [Indioceanicola profundi]|uniref:ADP-glyceromanno-heptose 6-epimerase n=1 Tax=Indioceanicola profundi TaxID=2220096 RepID=UPI000E6AB115|nr:ADP-glyceromanno-heptose 6-epimerase [Indioceanicola profundi]
MLIVTGGAGFIGSNLVAALEARGLGPIVVCDRMGSGDKWKNIAKRRLWDLIPPEALASFLDSHAGEVDTIFHLGAISATTERDADLIVANNFRLSLDLWDWCTRTDARLIYASSAATYGDGVAGFDDNPSAEALAALRPLNPYGWSKHLFDRRILAAVDAGDRRPRQWAGLKFFNVYGPNEYHKGDMMSVPAKLWPHVKAGEPARLFASDRPDYEDGGQMRDFVWVGDCVDVMVWLHANPGVNGLFNLGTGQARSWHDLATALYTSGGRPPLIEYIPMPDHLKGKYQYFTEARMDRLRAAGYDRPFTTLEEGIGRYVRDHLALPDPYV